MTWGPRACGTLVLAMLWATCARSVPPRSSDASLYRDVQRLVTLSETTGWDIDRLEVQALLPDVLMSVCRTDAPTRQRVMKWLDAQIIVHGGPVEVAYQRRGRQLKRIAKLLELVRIRLTLQHALDHLDDCPFWLEPRPRFRGRQIADNRWQLSFGGGGKGIVVLQGGREDINFGGGGRILFGRALGTRLTLLTGLELGASAAFPKDENGDRADLIFALDTVAPVVVRYRLVNSYLEFEAGYLGRYTEQNSSVDSGLHIGAAVGGRASRQRWFFPGAAFGISYERTFPTRGPALNMVKLGFRVAIDVDW